SSRGTCSARCSVSSAWRTRARRRTTRPGPGRRSTSSARRTSSTRTTTPATPSSPSTGRNTGRPPPSTDGGRCSRSLASICADDLPMKVAFGISLGSSVGLLGGSDTQKFMELVRMADGCGATAIGTYASAFLGGDAYVRATMMALAAPRAAIGLGPSNPLTREPQVMASFLASIDALTGGRAFLDIASGDSAVFNIGYPAASRARIEDYVTCIRGLLARGEATYQGRAQRVRWAAEAVRPRVPISICAEGPRMLHLGGRVGDGVMAGTGLLPEVIQDTIARVHAGAREAGRDPSEVDIWF